MKIVTEQKEKISIIRLFGELDASNAIEVDVALERVLKNKPTQIWVDGSEINYISSAGIGVFSSHLQTISRENINLVFYGLNSKIRNVFTILGLESILQIVNDQQAAEALMLQPATLTANN
ncbi:MAG TPA: STAS domain-containing protein [Adhaeribacter sp.]|nr:STAS domain-containing protein [Adhaeribacter sp.]